MLNAEKVEGSYCMRTICKLLLGFGRINGALISCQKAKL